MSNDMNCVLGTKYYVSTESDYLPYIKDYIDSINSGNPDKDSVISKYASSKNVEIFN